MEYKETLPDHLFSHHVESYWHIFSDEQLTENPLEMFLPTCTFNIIFIDSPCMVRSNSQTKWIHLYPGAYFIGQTNTSLSFKSKKAINITGVRFKPFAFANLIKNPLINFNDSIIDIEKVFPLDKTSHLLIKQISLKSKAIIQEQLINEFTNSLLSKTMSVDESLRAQLNFIMYRHGSIKVSELFEEFNVSKVTLHKHFINKVGLSPKKVSQIWRMNRILQLREEFPDMSLTSIGLEAGFYDQAHFIKDFNTIFKITPFKFFSQKSNLIEIANRNILKRFTNQYDPITS
ncbi:transcriptional regulator, AraC family [Aquimarina amphilecti]|uniref:Transcriptional regulator, AraC family n=1 Tax=Aquimarina amphilecti TaxID=1038014 RepID=A0A1H7QXI6_AQUAM|nr:helix-turn-helix domain-containing protein [Aquimarina amphilecti]SEL52355.1 transcriptional regulator, AraC family [Aquimarina amphilecti]